MGMTSGTHLAPIDGGYKRGASMTANPKSVADGYLNAHGDVEKDQCRLPPDELAWLVAHASRLSATRLERLRSLQTALPGAGGELKELLTDLIIIESRLAGRGERLQGLAAELKDDALPAGVPVDERRRSAGGRAGR